MACCQIAADRPLQRILCRRQCGHRHEPGRLRRLVIKGASDRPLWLEITDQGVFFHDADDLWGLDTFETEAALRKKVAANSPGILVIGPAGENCVRFAVIKNDGWRVCGRTGMGAVLGSKKIKAVVFHGSRKRPFADPEGLKAYAKENCAIQGPPRHPRLPQ
jgi:aldehyde:ferredoxin oxidoreductase